MIKNSITVHSIVKNEDRFIYYSLKSISNYADKILVYDTGSDDRTLEIIKKAGIKNLVLGKFNIQKVGEIAQLRQKQLEESKTDWIWLVDGDEIYPDFLCHEIREMINRDGPGLEGIVVRRFDLLGDIYHYQGDDAGYYDLFGRRGHFAIRLINRKNISGLHVEGIYPYEEYFDSNGGEIINHEKSKFKFTKGNLFHAMYLPRSTLGGNLRNTFHRQKIKFEKGLSLSDTSLIPKVFFERNVKEGISIVTEKRGLGYEFISDIMTPLKRIKRFITN